MVHTFDVEIAKLYGMPAAVILSNLEYWIEKNKANNKHFYDGYTWTYNSRKAFEAIFPYMTSRQIQYATDKLIEEGLIITGNYNDSAYDRTLWYAITKKGYSILQNCKMDETKVLNEIDKIVKPIPYNKPNNKQTDIKTNNKEKEKKENLFSEFADQFSFVENTREDLISALNDFVEARKEGKKPMTAQAVKRHMNRLAQFAGSDGDKAIKILDTSIRKGWTDIYELKDYSKGRKEPESRPAPLDDGSDDELADLTAKLAEMGYKWNEEKGDPRPFILKEAIGYNSALNSYIADRYVVKI